MKKSILAPLAFALPFLLSAQTPFVTLTDDDGNEVNGTVIVSPCSVSAETDTVHLYATLNAAVSREVNVRRYELGTVPGSTNFFCWGLCFAPREAGERPVWVGSVPVMMEPGVETSGFGAYYSPNAAAGTAGFRFVFYDTDSPTDTAWVDILFDVSTGVKEAQEAVLSFDAYPNPTVDGSMTLRCTLHPTLQGASMVVYDALGSKVLIQPIRGNGGTVVLPREKLQPGMYFATIEANGRALLTKRLAVGSR
ncbi:MAG: T9SS type A sorting domain-containing protein [Flavobacteriales bacterium]|nr:T9SS type A sorting domain-containing protein [Flavobacteriales bacterium]